MHFEAKPEQFPYERKQERKREEVVEGLAGYRQQRDWKEGGERRKERWKKGRERGKR